MSDLNFIVFGLFFIKRWARFFVTKPKTSPNLGVFVPALVSSKPLVAVSTYDRAHAQSKTEK